MNCLITKPEIDLNILDAGIERTQPHYIIMNQRTLYLMWQKNIPKENWNKQGNDYDAYKGIPVAICEKLIDGEVDLI